MTIISCAEWGARSVDTSPLARSRARGIVVHHTTSGNVAPLIDPGAERERCFRLARGIQQDHMGRNHWVDSGQNFTNCRGGLVLEGRHGSLAAAEAGRVLRGAHAGTTDGNLFYVGIENEGNTNEAPLTELQWASLIELCAWLAWKGDFDTASILPHNHFRPTACPGAWLLGQLDALRAAAHTRKLALLAAG